MIGSDEGYEEGDIIETKDVLGRIYKISPLLTTIEEQNSQGFTGKILTFPNKFIFDNPIKNYSRSGGYTIATVDIVITHDSDAQKARDILMNIIGKDDIKMFYQSHRVIRKLKSIYHYNDKDLHPRIDVIIDTRGTILRARIFTHTDSIHQLESQIALDFLAATYEHDDITLRQI